MREQLRCIFLSICLFSVISNISCNIFNSKNTNTVSSKNSDPNQHKKLDPNATSNNPNPASDGNSLLNNLGDSNTPGNSSSSGNPDQLSWDARFTNIYPLSEPDLSTSTWETTTTSCPGDSVMAGFISSFYAYQQVRLYRGACQFITNGNNVTMKKGTCINDTVTLPTAKLKYSCPMKNQFITGYTTSYKADSKDTTFQFQCCTMFDASSTPLVLDPTLPMDNLSANSTGSCDQPISSALIQQQQGQIPAQFLNDQVNKKYYGFNFACPSNRVLAYIESDFIQGSNGAGSIDLPTVPDRSFSFRCCAPMTQNGYNQVTGSSNTSQ